MALSTLFGACAQPAPTVQIGNTLTPTPELTTVQTKTEIPTSSSVPPPSSLVFPYLTADAGNFALLAGETITFTWENAPIGAEKYEFVLAPQNKETPFVLGIDVDESDGVAVSWTISEKIAAELRATAYFPDGRQIELSFAPMIYSGDFPPIGVCSILARYQPVEVYRLPDRTAEIFALLHPSAYAHVLEIAPNGWYRIDASAAELYTPPVSILPDPGFREVALSVVMNFELSPASGDGWVNSDKGVLLIGSCPP